MDLRANTQVVVAIGPFVAVANGYVPVTDIVLTGAGAADEAELIKHGGTTGVDISGNTWAVLNTAVDGYYNLTLTTDDTNTEGNLLVVIQDDSACLPVKAEFNVMAEAAWDSLYAAKDAGFMDVNIKTIGRADTTETEATNLEAACAAYSVTRGLTGTALPAVAAGSALGVPLKDANSFLDVANMPAVAAGGAGGLLISGSNAGTTTLGALTVTGATNLTGAVALGSTLGVTGAVTLSDALTVGATTFASAAVTGALSVGTTTTLTGNVSLGGTLAVDGATTFTGVVTHTAGLVSNITGNLSGSVGTLTALGADCITAAGIADDAFSSEHFNTGAFTADAFAADALVSATFAADYYASINGEVIDVLATDTHAEIGQETPAATQSYAKMLGYLYKVWRNQSWQTATEYTLYNDAADTVDQKAAVSDDATTFKKGEIASGPS